MDFGVVESILANTAATFRMFNAVDWHLWAGATGSPLIADVEDGSGFHYTIIRDDSGWGFYQYGIDGSMVYEALFDNNRETIYTA